MAADESRSMVPDPAGSGVVVVDDVADQRPHRKRILGPYLFSVFFLVTLNFLLPRTLPGDPISAMVVLGSSSGSSTYVQDDGTRAALTRYYGLDKPLVVQYGRYLGGLARGDLGVSIRRRQPVRSLIAERLPWTLLLATTSLVVAMGIGLPAGIHSGWRRGRSADRRLLTLFMGLRNFPAFFFGTLALYLFSVKLGWVPLGGAQTPFTDLGPLRRAADIAWHLALPVTVMAMQMSAGHYLLMRAGMVSEIGADYLLLGRAKGVPERRLKYRYAARNALLPVVSLTAMELGFAVTGLIFVETVFAYPGTGRLLFEAVSARDYPLIQGCFLFITVGVVTLNLAADLVYRRLDPRTAA